MYDNGDYEDLVWVSGLQRARYMQGEFLSQYMPSLLSAHVWPPVTPLHAPSSSLPLTGKYFSCIEYTCVRSSHSCQSILHQSHKVPDQNIVAMHVATSSCMLAIAVPTQQDTNSSLLEQRTAIVARSQVKALTKCRLRA